MHGRGSSSLGSLGLSGVRLKQVKLRGIRRWVSLVERRKNIYSVRGGSAKRRDSLDKSFSVRGGPALLLKV